MIRVVNEKDSNEFEKKVNDLMNEGYEISSTNCVFTGDYEYYAGIMVKRNSEVDAKNYESKIRHKLKICYMTDLKDRLENAKEYFTKSYCRDITSITENCFETEDGEFHFVDCGKRENYIGLKVEQAIIDYRHPMIEIAESITDHSILPKDMRIVDDRRYGLSDIRRKQ